MDEFLKDLTPSLDKVLENLKHEFILIRTGRATPHLVEKVQVEYYGSVLPLQQVAGISIPEARTIEIKPWDLNALDSIVKGIQKANLGLTPQNDGKLVRLNIPALTEDRRKELVKMVRKIAEDHRVSMRNVRRDFLKELKDAEKDKKISEDDRKKKEEQAEKTIKDKLKLIDDIMGHKEKEIMEV